MAIDDPRLNDLSGHVAGEPRNPIKMAATNESIEIKLGLLNFLPKFYGKKDEDPYKFIYEFIKMCRLQKRAAGVSEEQVRLTVFPFTLSAEANTWFRRLPASSVATWADMEQIFVDYYFPWTKTIALKREIIGIEQEFDETLSNYWARFQELLDSCPNHKFSEGDLLLYFYHGMTIKTKDLVNMSSRGAFTHCRVSEGKKIIENLANAMKEYKETPRTHNKVAQTHASGFEDELNEKINRTEKLLNNVMEKLTVTGPIEQPCGLCGNTQPLQNDLQSHGDAIQSLVRSQKEQKVRLDCLAFQMSQLSLAMHDIKRNQDILNRSMCKGAKTGF